MGGGTIAAMLFNARYTTAAAAASNQQQRTSISSDYKLCLVCVVHYFNTAVGVWLALMAEIPSKAYAPFDLRFLASSLCNAL